jgi:hypothetical protein
VFVCTFSGCVEAFSTQTETAQEVARCLFKEIIPQFRIPVSIGLDNGLAFVAEVEQLVGGQGLKNNLEAAHGQPPPEFRESRTYEQDFKITIGKTMPGDSPIMGSATAHSLA